MNPEEFAAALREHNVELNAQQLAQYQQYYERLVAVNEHMNLTAITERDEVYLKHFYDSLTLAWAYPELQTEELNMIDVGAGAGFPSLPLKIAFPQLQITIIDALNKRINFLRDLVKELGLEGVTVEHARAEEFGNKTAPAREQYDVATARALARLNVLGELTLPFVKVGGVLLAMKGSAADEELAEAKKAITTLGAEIGDQIDVSLPNGDPRSVIVIKKVKNTPKKYPRKPGDPVRKPL
ncbi:16S rRNA (guanine(527)-N(7))-methyltransferase RsmG [Weissella confusa]|uniref:16S rRNA (guanine(527)-N(7))-methyltransferase RsmG n=1 Tax=Weissella confusa TaxID=1583 RepID=UPI000DCA5903|nr:16S rRNA (guanine(527)-N(7))-methyltransferase RsmG [Weissella confusa]MBD1490625.1 16S rRNA (guanine(527)-N(7))-methyltransferase RsmG [Weissella confusa]MBD5833618.1 16S rRNA (guanine(527)-N(7))-methyltransferase RsmG [Weissella confusa]MBF7057642.1 16S rRNA (guanine(527)-N(7))-methyltransferase RsmG [Weissella confusa]MBJ7621314.1 16S rRNA (guanine(527)-N(7))-methyltransferase RsmG [Weissella confusa]MBJ7630502.1 16S rRNA (guanine(527)-N(7))-methyltransferase RsmG [Weissella confusa]